MGMRVSSNSAASQSGVAAWQQRQQSVRTLSKALQGGDLDSAKAAFAALTGNNSATGASNPNSPLAQVGQALQNGDVAGAQKAFAAMRSGHHHGGHQAVPVTATLAPTTATPTTGNNVDTFA